MLSLSYFSNCLWAISFTTIGQKVGFNRYALHPSLGETESPIVTLEVPHSYRDTHNKLKTNSGRKEQLVMFLVVKTEDIRPLRD